MMVKAHSQRFQVFSWWPRILPLCLLLGAIEATPAQSPGREMIVRSDIQESNSQTGVITARGNVQIFYPARDIQATAAQAQYYSKEQRLVLSGNVYVLQRGNSMRAETMVYLLDREEFLATPKAAQQVESIYIFTDEEEETPTANNPQTGDRPATVEENPRLIRPNLELLNPLGFPETTP